MISRNLRGNPRDVLLVEEADPVAETLHEISKAVKKAYGKKIWKGITGPEDSGSFTDYWLWVEPGLDDELEEGSCRNFRVVRCTPFEGNGVQFSYGVSIEVSVFERNITADEEQSIMNDLNLKYKPLMGRRRRGEVGRLLVYRYDGKGLFCGSYYICLHQNNIGKMARRSKAS